MIAHLFFSFVLLLTLGPLSTANAQSKVLISAPSKSLSWFPIHLAREKGFYRAEGLDLDYVLMKPQLAMQALITGDVGYTTALGSTIRAALRNVPLRVVMTIADKPLFTLVTRPGIGSVEELRGKVLGISSFGASSDTYARAVGIFVEDRSRAAARRLGVPMDENGRLERGERRSGDAVVVWIEVEAS